jgi:hypothetical protein
VISLAVTAADRCFVAPGDYAALKFPPPSRHDPPSAPQGLQIIDLSALPASVSLETTYGGFDRAHNI